MMSAAAIPAAAVVRGRFLNPPMTGRHRVSSRAPPMTLVAKLPGVDVGDRGHEGRPQQRDDAAPAAATPRVPQLTVIALQGVPGSVGAALLGVRELTPRCGRL